MRKLFIGIPVQLSAENLRIVKEFSYTLIGENLHFEASEKYHITLKFLGNTEVRTISDICDTLKKIVSQTTKFCFATDKIGIFGEPKKPKVLYFGIKQNNLLFGLQKVIENSMLLLGFSAEMRIYIPHITLARIRFIQNISRFENIICSTKLQRQQIDLSEIILYESIRIDNSIFYKKIESFTLK